MVNLPSRLQALVASNRRPSQLRALVVSILVASPCNAAIGTLAYSLGYGLWAVGALSIATSAVITWGCSDYEYWKLRQLQRLWNWIDELRPELDRQLEELNRAEVAFGYTQISRAYDISEGGLRP